MNGRTATLTNGSTSAAAAPYPQANTTSSVAASDVLRSTRLVKTCAAASVSSSGAAHCHDMITGNAGTAKRPRTVAAVEKSGARKKIQAKQTKRNVSALAETEYRASASGLNDNNLANNVDLSGQGGDVPNAYEGAGVLWSTAQAVSKVVFVNGSYTASQDGVFDAGFTLQFTTDGTTWTNATNWTLSSAYAYNSPSAGGATYTFTGPTTNVLGFRVVGQVYTSATGVNSWYDQASEVQAF